MRVSLLLIPPVALATVAPARAADTTEPFAPGLSDFEVYLAMEGLGRPPEEAAVSGEVLLGLGFTPRFSGFVTLDGSADGALGAGAGGAGFGLLGTIVDRDHLDLDVFWSSLVSADSFSLCPALEINLDLAPDLSVAGLYLRAQEHLAGREQAEARLAPWVGELRGRHTLAPTTTLTAGAYWTVAARHQVLVEADVGVPNGVADDAAWLDPGGVALGYNTLVTAAIELISEVRVDLPADGERASVGILVGVIAAVPGAGGT